jgi:hypothetical protein
MDKYIIILLVIVGIIATLDKGKHRWLGYAWFTILGVLLGVYLSVGFIMLTM